MIVDHDAIGISFKTFKSTYDYLSACMSVYLSISPFVGLLICLSLRLYVCPSVYLTVCTSVYSSCFSGVAVTTCSCLTWDQQRRQQDKQKDRQTACLLSSDSVMLPRVSSAMAQIYWCRENRLSRPIGQKARSSLISIGWLPVEVHYNWPMACRHSLVLAYRVVEVHYYWPMEVLKSITIGWWSSFATLVA